MVKQGFLFEHSSKNSNDSFHQELQVAGFIDTDLNYKKYDCKNKLLW